MLSTPATIATARRVLGLTPDELGDLLHVSARTIRHWESGKHVPPAGAIDDYRKLLDDHNSDVRAVRAVVAEGAPVVLPTNSPYPDGWWLAAAARVLTEFPGAVVEWHDGECDADAHYG